MGGLTAVFLLGAGGRTRRAANNDEFYQRVKASVRDVETFTQNEAEPATPAELITQTQYFVQDITRHNRRSIHYYCLIGRNLNALRLKKELSSAARTLHYSTRHIQFLMNLYRLSSYYTKIKRITVPIRELKTNFKALREGVMTEKEFWR